MEAYSHGTTPTIREVANEGDVQLSSSSVIETGEHTEEGAPESDAKEQSGVLQDAISALGPDPDFTVFVDGARSFAEGSATNPRQRQRKAPTRVEEAKARVARFKGALRCWVWTVQMQNRSKSLWKQREDNVVFSLVRNVSILA